MRHHLMQTPVKAPCDFNLDWSRELSIGIGSPSTIRDLKSESVAFSASQAYK
jgi:hypothetical protein